MPGHEVVGILDAVGAGVTQFKPGQRVGVGWHGGHCGSCDNCRNGDFFACTVNLQFTGISFDGGYAEYMVAPAVGVALVPEELSAVEAAPLMCAGITTYNALRNSAARAGDLVRCPGLGRSRSSRRAIRGEDGFQNRGHRARARTRNRWRNNLARGVTLTVRHRIRRRNCRKLGGAKVIIATVTNGDAMSAVQGGLGVNGTLIVIGAAQSMTVSPLLLLMGRRSVKGWYSGTAMDSQDTLAFSVLSGVRSMNEVYPLERSPKLTNAWKAARRASAWC